MKKPAKIPATLRAHAEFTVRTLERFHKNRSWCLKGWEAQLLHSAYEALGTIDEARLYLVDPECGIVPRRHFNLLRAERVKDNEDN